MSPYIGGQEVNRNPTHSHHRYVIDFGERRENECRANWPALMAIVEDKVRPIRSAKDGNKYPRMVNEWWKYWNPRPKLYAKIAQLDRILVINCQATKHLALAFLPSRMVFANSLVIVALDTYASLCCLQSHPHEIWARFFGSTLEDRLRYTPSDVFETFPFPATGPPTRRFEAVGQAYYGFRADLMVMNDEGLTKTYNRFHDPNERNPDIAELRTLHAAMDRAVLDAYGWTDIPTDCEFLPEHEDDDDEGSSRRKKRYRYRWPNPVHDEVLGRLMELNAERAEEERRALSEEARKR